LPADLRDAPSGPDFDALPFTSVYLLEDEWAAEIANRTIHGVMHIGWVPDDTGGFRAHMAVYVKPNGLLGSAYMAAIRPFRHLIVYPPMLREMGRNWRAAAECAGKLLPWNAGLLNALALERSFSRLRVARINPIFARLNFSSAENAGVHHWPFHWGSPGSFIARTALSPCSWSVWCNRKPNPT
jgi:hypothetical protein